MLNVLKTRSPHQIGISHFCAYFFLQVKSFYSDCGLFLYVAYKQREVSVSAYTHLLLKDDLISWERWDSQRLDP